MTQPQIRRVRFHLPGDEKGDEAGSAAETVAHTFLQRRLERAKQATREMFLLNYGMEAEIDQKSSQIAMRTRINDEYGRVKHLPPVTGVPKSSGKKKHKTKKSIVNISVKPSNPDALEDSTRENISAAPRKTIESHLDDIQTQDSKRARLNPSQNANDNSSSNTSSNALVTVPQSSGSGQRALTTRAGSFSRVPRPDWHAPWVLKTVLSGHQGWVRSVAVDVSNEWFCTGSDDRTIKIWDLASGSLKLTLTGHISAITGLAVSAQRPYMFSVSDDKTVRCWDLEQNKVIRSYHGHLSGVYAVALHPEMDILCTSGRDSTCRVWDIRTKAQLCVLSGHTNTVGTVQCQAADPQIITGSHDSTIRLWDLRTQKTSSVLTNHKKSVRALQIHPTEYTFSSASADNIKVWKCPQGQFLRNMQAVGSIVNTMALNQDNVLVSGSDEGTLKFWDWKTGYCFHSIKPPPQPGSLDSECGIFASAFDQTGSRLITCEADKSIKIWREDENATPETHPVNFRPKRKRSRF